MTSAVSSPTDIRGVALPGARFGAVQSIAIAVAVGTAVGVATSFGQGVMPGALNALVNSAAAWLVAPFFVGALTGRSLRGATLAGLLTCVLQVAGYYVTSELRGFAAGGTTVVLFWAACGLLGGPLLGAGGWWWRHGQGFAHSVGAAVLPSVFLVEGVWLYGVTLGSPARTALWLTIAVTLGTALSHPNRNLRAYALLIPAGLLGEIALTALTNTPM